MKKGELEREPLGASLYEGESEPRKSYRPYTEIDAALADSKIQLSRDAAAGFILGYAVGYTARHLSAFDEPQVRGYKIDHAIDEAFKTLAGEEKDKKKIIEYRMETGKKMPQFTRRFFYDLVEGQETDLDDENIYNRSEAYLKAKLKYLEERLKLDREDTDIVRGRLEKVRELLYDRKHNVEFHGLFVSRGWGPYPWKEKGEKKRKEGIIDKAKKLLKGGKKPKKVEE